MSDVGSTIDDLQVSRRDKWTVERDWKYRLWELWIIVICFSTTLLYPYVILNDLYYWEETLYRLLWVGEIFMALDICVKFFLQELDDDGLNSKKEALEVIAMRYLKKGFILDIVAFLPFPLICQ